MSRSSANSSAYRGQEDTIESNLVEGLSLGHIKLTGPILPNILAVHKATKLDFGTNFLNL
jgi:hypothetical protein